MKFIKVMAVSTLMYGSEARMLSKNDMSHMQAAEMKFFKICKRMCKDVKITNDIIRIEIDVTIWNAMVI